MTTLVTGATGFVGLNIVEALVGRGEEVVAFGLGTWPDEATTLMASDATLHVVEGDVRDAGALDRVFRDFVIDRVVHGAAITAGVQREAMDPQPIIDVNVSGTAAVIQAAHKHGVKRVVHLSSGAAYGESLQGKELLYEETSPSRPVSLYAITKYAGERVALRLRELYGLDLVCARLGSVFGPWERRTGARDHVSVFLQLARLAAAGEEALLPLPTPRRDYVYSRDVAAGVVALLEAERLPHCLYHLTSGWPWDDPVEGWCRTLSAAYPGFSYRGVGRRERPNVTTIEEQDRASMDVGLIREDIGFEAGFTEADAFRDYVTWLSSVPGWLSAQPEKALR
jgi:nucleoside-diphosphate-sugar epimerase